MKEAFAFCPEHTCFALLWILHKNGEKINIGEQTIHKDFEQELRLKKISFLSVSSVYSKSPAPKLQQATKRSKGPLPQKLSIKNAVLAFILPELQNSLNNAQIYPGAKKS